MDAELFRKAVRRGDMDLAKAFLDDHPDWVNSRFKNQWTALHWAVSDGDEVMVDLLIARGSDVHARGESGETPLHLAESLPVCRLLLAAGASPTAKDENGMTPLDWAKTLKDKQLLQLLGGHRESHPWGARQLN